MTFVPSQVLTAADLNSAFGGKTAVADLASTANVALGDALVGVNRTLANAVATTLHGWIEGQVVNAFDCMTAAQISDVTTRTASLDVSVALQNCINAVSTLGGGAVEFSPGKYRLASPLTMLPGVSLVSSGRTGIDNTSKPGAQIVSSASDLFVNSASTITGILIDGLWLQSDAGGGHIFNWSSAGIVAKIEVRNCVLVQSNAAKSVIQGTSAGGVFSIWLHDFEYKYAASNTAPAINIVSPTVNSIVIENFWSTGANVSAGTYSIWIESTNAAGGCLNCVVRQGVFELPAGGAVQMLSCNNSGIDQCATYDLTVTPNNAMFRIAKGASGPASSNSWAHGVRSTTGTAAKPDLQLDLSVAGQSAFRVSECTLTWLDGVSAANGPGVVITGGAIANFENIAYTYLPGSAASDLAFKSTSGTSKNYTLWNGFAGNFDGYFNIYQNGAYVGAISPTGLLEWGGSQTVPAFYVGQGGVINTTNKIFPGTDGLAGQASCGLFAGSGAPVNTNGANGDIYFRGDGATGTTIYQKRAGAWVGVV